MKYEIFPHQLIFNFPAKTSRSSLSQKTSWLIKISNESAFGYGEIAPLEGLSPELNENFGLQIHHMLNEMLTTQADFHSFLQDYPSIRFGWETALLDLQNGSKQKLFDSAFSRSEKGIRINGLVWMGEFQYMKDQIRQKIEKGFSCIKLKVGAIEFEKELELIKMIRKEFSEKDLCLRLDANGAFTPNQAIEKLNRFADYNIHSIEQPIRAYQIEEMSKICRNSPIPVALDEELISVNQFKKKEEVLNAIQPQYIILKPSLLGGIKAADEWIQLAEKKGIGWWNTSALESNIGLNAIAQWTASLNPDLPQGLGTGQLYVNNISSPLTINGEYLYYLPEVKWQMPF